MTNLFPDEDTPDDCPAWLPIGLLAIVCGLLSLLLL